MPGPATGGVAGFVRAGQEVNHRLRAEAVPAGPGTLPRLASLGSVEPDNVVLTALKPRGNPIAAGLPGDTDLADGVTLRLYEIAGSPARARIRLHGGLSGPTVTDVLEQARPGGPAVTADGDEVTVELDPADVVTLGRATGAAAARCCRRARPASSRSSPSSPGTGCTTRAPRRWATCRSACTCTRPLSY